MLFRETKKKRNAITASEFSKLKTVRNTMKMKISVATKLFGQKQGFRLSAQCCDALETQDKIKKTTTMMILT